jgi:two-component system chemotaxis response regulator CheB
MDQAQVRQELIGKIKALCAKKLTTGVPADPAAGEAPRLDVVVIGVSTGGPNALSNLLPRLQSSFPVPILIVQHMPPLFTRFLAERLAGQCALTVREAVHGSRPEAGSIWIAPGDYHMIVEKTEEGPRLHVHQGPPENSCRPSVDPLFRSAVECYGAHVLGVIMTGMGQDGLQGSRCIHDAGGQIVAQDEASSVVWSMPRCVVEEGIADAVLPLDQLAHDICARVEVGRRGLDEIHQGGLVA